MSTILFLLTIVSMLCPLLIFLDYHKPGNLHIGIVYILVFTAVYGVALPLLIKNGGLYFAGSLPFLVLLIGIVAKKKKT